MGRTVIKQCQQEFPMFTKIFDNTEPAHYNIECANGGEYETD